MTHHNVTQAALTSTGESEAAGLHHMSWGGGGGGWGARGGVHLTTEPTPPTTTADEKKKKDTQRAAHVSESSHALLELLRVVGQHASNAFIGQRAT